MTPDFTVTVRIGGYEFIKKFGADQQAALECYDLLARDASQEVEGNSATQPSDSRIDSVTIHRNIIMGRIGDPNRRINP